MGASPLFPGVTGLSTFAPGVYGHQGLPGEDVSLIPNGLVGGLVGSSIFFSGVIGWSNNYYGVTAFTVKGDAAVVAQAQNGFGVWALSSTAPGVEAVSGANGPAVPNTSNIAGVVGTSDRQHGVIGRSNASVGVIGFSNNIGVFGYTTNPQAQAGHFLGDVVVEGNFTVVGFPGYEVRRGTVSRRHPSRALLHGAAGRGEPGPK